MGSRLIRAPAMAMPQSGLQVEQAPPFSVPLRFFLTAPAFALLAAILLAWRGPEVLASRWTPAALAVVHLLVLGFMTMVMVGAMMQVLPVLAGAPLAKPRLVAGLTHVALASGTLALAGGFLWSQPALLGAAVTLLGAGFAVFLGAVFHGLARAMGKSAAAGEMWLAAIALALAVLLGLALAAARGWGAAVPVTAWRDLHPAWALLGWTGLLVAAVARQVVPMFQITPPYPRLLARFFAVVVFALLTLWSAAKMLPGSADGAVLVLGVVLAAAYALFALVTLELQRRRRRRAADVTLRFWRLGMASLAAASLAWAARLLGVAPEGFDAALGALVIVGGAMSLINGMLYKIAPFLAWFHLQAGGGGRGMHMKSFLADARQKRQYALHVAAVLLLLGATLGTAVLIYPAAACLGLSALLLQANLAAVVRVYRRASGHDAGA